MGLNECDTSVDVYAAAIALQEGNEKGASVLVEKARQLNADYTSFLVMRDPVLQSLVKLPEKGGDEAISHE